MDQITDSQELARRFNEDEAVWQCYEYIRARRLLCGVDSVLSDEVQDALEWIEAEHQCRQTRSVGKRLSAHDAHIEN
jgi:hypothetical protein